MIVYDTLLEAINGLKERGYTLDFNLAFDQLKCDSADLCLSPAQFEIDEVHRFDTDTDPGESSIVFAVSSIDKKHKGVLISAYGMYAEPLEDSLMRKLSMHTHNN